MTTTLRHLSITEAGLRIRTAPWHRLKAWFFLLVTTETVWLPRIIEHVTPFVARLKLGSIGEVIPVSAPPAYYYYLILQKGCNNSSTQTKTAIMEQYNNDVIFQTV
jgi:hypothetical protein